ncbi:hypothetical protein [Ruegeria sp. HKCCD7255]|uniref:hypothetical protein n=1 Tax=Ruegeria sp. HKCCD7255 TaxID=2683004 RepID=UPI0014885B71|nr:hypothetical protein [Ruegeria sp. HKCCD7255]
MPAAFGTPGFTQNAAQGDIAAEAVNQLTWLEARTMGTADIIAVDVYPVVIGDAGNRDGQDLTSELSGWHYARIGKGLTRASREVKPCRIC